MSNLILMIAEADSFWTKRYIEYVLLPLNKQIQLLTPSNEKYREFYDKNNVLVVTTYRDSWIDRVPKFNTLLSRIRLIRYLKNTNSDIVMMQYVFPSILKSIKSLHFKRLILTYWGSDLFRVKDTELQSLSNAVGAANDIVVMTENMRDVFVEKYPQVELDRIHIIDMGVSAFSEIDRLYNKREMIKNDILKENYGKKVVTIGYNADSQQQHNHVLNILNSLKPSEKKDLHIFLPLTYRKTDSNYLSEIYDLVESCGVSYTIFDEFMDDTSIARLCLATDYFVNAQTTDALSSSMLEYIYSGAYMISGNWLSYKFLDDNEIQYQTFSKFEDLKVLLVNGRGKNSDENRIHNREQLKDKCSWNACKTSWEKLL